MSILTGVIYLLIGLVACFFGKRFYRIVLALVGFGVGYYIMAGLLVEQGETVQLVGAIIGGVVVGFLFWSLYKFAYVIFGLFLGLIIGGLVVRAFNLDGVIAIIIVAVLALLGAFLGGGLADLIIRLSTAFGGATYIVAGVAGIAAALGVTLPLLDPTHGVTADTTAGIITTVAVVILGVLGFMFQSGRRT